MIDFTLQMYRLLLKTFIKADYNFKTIEDYLLNPQSKSVMLRHDVDRNPQQALEMAKIENELNIKSSYYFRIVRVSYNEKIIKQIEELGHEIGYHYEDLSLAKGNYKKAISSFEKNLNLLRQLYPVKTICMHGSPLSKWDNRLIWKKYNYKNYGILGDSYLDIDFNVVLYLTDTGRRWDGAQVSLRDKVESSLKYYFKSSFNIISASQNNALPDQILITTHPHRWNDSIMPWFLELVGQSIKNIIKSIIVKIQQGIILKNNEINLNILFYLGHPAHYHLFKNIIKKLESDNYETVVLIKKKDILEDLLKKSKLKYLNILPHGRKDNKISIALSLIHRDIKILLFCLKKKPHIMIGTSTEIAHVGRILKIPSIIVNEDDFDQVPLFAKTGYPFTNSILVPSSCKVGKWSYKTISYEGYHELSYLHPKYFKPDIKKVKKYINTDRSYFIIRFAKLTAHHDKGKTGISNELAKKIISLLKPYGNIFITSERELGSEFETYKIQIDPIDIHHALYYADMFIGDSQTMTAEAAVLGTPAIRFNDFVGKLGYLEELEHKYKLTFGIQTSEPEQLLTKITEILHIPNFKKEWEFRRKKMLDDKINVAQFITWIIKYYPNSIHTMQKNPDYQWNFK